MTDKLPFQKVPIPTTELVGHTLCPACHKSLPVSLDIWNGKDRLYCPCGGISTFHSFAKDQAEAQASKLTNTELDLDVKEIDQSPYWESQTSGPETES